MDIRLNSLAVSFAQDAPFSSPCCYRVSLEEGISRPFRARISFLDEKCLSAGQLEQLLDTAAHLALTVTDGAQTNDDGSAAQCVRYLHGKVGSLTLVRSLEFSGSDDLVYLYELELVSSLASLSLNAHRRYYTGLTVPECLREISSPRITSVLRQSDSLSEYFGASLVLQIGRAHV